MLFCKCKKYKYLLVIFSPNPLNTAICLFYNALLLFAGEQ